MQSSPNSKRAASLALSLLTLLSACGQSGSPVGPAPLPPLDPRDAAACSFPEIGTEALSSLTRHRVALAECSRKHQNVVSQYQDARQTFGSGKGPQ